MHMDVQHKGEKSGGVGGSGGYGSERQGRKRTEKVPEKAAWAGKREKGRKKM